jgi:GGDEF domain-containing protein
VIRGYGGKGDFIGHIGGDDFIIITEPRNAERICSGIIEQFDRRIKELYSGEDVERGYICTTNRTGEHIEYSIMSISLAVISNIDCRFQDHLQLAESAAELKKKVKALAGSGFMMN